MKSQSQHKFLLKLLLIYSQRAQNSSEGGFVVIMAIAMVLILSLLVLSYAIMSKVDTFTQNASAKSKSGFYAAEAGLNIRAKEIRATFDNFNRPSGDSPTDLKACLDTNTSNNGTADFLCRSETFQGHQIITYVDELPDNPVLITINEGDAYVGLNAQEYRYDVMSAAFDNENLPTTILGMRFKSRLVPMFQFAAFYDKDLEILPGPSMTLSGPVHSNYDLYLNSDNNLTIKGQVTVHKTLYRGRKNNSNCSGTVNIFDPTSAKALACNGGRSEITSADGWNGQIRLGSYYLELPPEGMLDPKNNSQSPYWTKADLRIILRLDSNNNPAAIEIRNANLSVDSTRTSALLNSCTVPSTTVTATPPTESSTGATNSQILVASTTGFSIGDAITVGTDMDSNVISAISGNTITLRRKLAHPYQNTSGADSTNPLKSAVGNGVVVRKAIVSTSLTFHNYREGKPIRMFEVDMQALLDCAHQNNLLQDSRAISDDTNGGLVWYFTIDGPDSNINMIGSSPPSDGNNYGIRLRNAQELRSTVAGAPAIKGLTVVTDQALYVTGNYNSVNKKPAAFLADTINVFSANWQLDDFRSRVYDTNNLPRYVDSEKNNSFPYKTGAVSLSERPAASTTINAAFLSATDTTGDASTNFAEGDVGQGKDYNGGLENYPRFHEDWGNSSTLFYRGSFVSLNRPRKVNGGWCSTGGSVTRKKGSTNIAFGTLDDGTHTYNNSGCNNYNAPVRNWDYDLDFNNAANLPPLTPRVTYLRQEVFSREFERPE